jgi:23S rRNA (adenine2503-C2)-methyltransferase
MPESLEGFAGLLPAEGWAGLLPAEIASRAGFSQAFRGKQVFRWIARGAASWSEMTDLPESERSRLEASSPLLSCPTAARLADPDGTVKIALRLSDGAQVECVLLIDAEDRRTACLSTQVGCPMDCAFCKTGSLGFQRNLLASEIIEQFLALNREGEGISNIVFMGMGEPLLNLNELRRSIEILRHPDGLFVGARKITISTSGIIAGILDLAAKGPQVRLAISLTSADPELRARLMPVEKANPLPELKEALLAYQEATGDRITLEVVVLGGMNGRASDAQAIARFCKGLHAQVNIIPWNPVPELPFQEPSLREVEAFHAQLEGLGVLVTRRMRRGRGVSGACGQLGGLSGEAAEIG